MLDALRHGVRRVVEERRHHRERSRSAELRQRCLPLELILDLLPDVPAGKLAIAELESTTREEVLALERAGVDAVLVWKGAVAELVGGPPPEV